MSAETFDTLTDWIGIPLVVLVIVLLIVDDLWPLRGRTLLFPLRRTSQVLVVLFFALVVARFIRLA